MAFDICAYRFSSRGQNAFYSHLHFKAPHLQAQPHTSFEEEVSGEGSVLPLVIGMTDGV